MSNQMEEVRLKLTLQDVIRYLLAYTCWLLSASIAMLALLQIRSAFNVVWPALGGSKWVLRPIDRFGLVFLGLVWLAYTIFAEHDYRSSVAVVRMRRARLKAGLSVQKKEPPKNQVMRTLGRLGLDLLVQRFIPMTAIPLALLLVSYLVEKATFRLLIR
jgi:hypothetical protein